MFEFSEGVNIIVGPNGSGKTNLLESVLIAATGGSYRQRDLNLIRHRSTGAFIESTFDGSERKTKIFSINEKIQKQFSIDGKKYLRLSLEKTQPVVLFEPNNLLIIFSGPSTRREYFDWLLSQTVSGYSKLLSSYKRTLAQRNSLLKKGEQIAKRQMFAWDIKLTELGQQIAENRIELIEKINSQSKNIYQKISAKKNNLTVLYKSKNKVENYSSAMLAGLQNNFMLDLARGFTGNGPHRDDYEFYLNDSPALESASRGEIRSIILSLKIIELGLIEEARGKKPTLLLDDVFSELDSKRRAHLVNYLSGHQSIITTTDADSVEGYFTGKTKIIKL